MANFNHQSCSSDGFTNSEFRLSLDQLEKRELVVFSSDLETVIPIGQKNHEKLEFRFGESML